MPLHTGWMDRNRWPTIFKSLTPAFFPSQAPEGYLLWLLSITNHRPCTKESIQCDELGSSICFVLGMYVGQRNLLAVFMTHLVVSHPRRLKHTLIISCCNQLKLTGFAQSFRAPLSVPPCCSRSEPTTSVHSSIQQHACVTFFSRRCSEDAAGLCACIHG